MFAFLTWIIFPRGLSGTSLGGVTLWSSCTKHVPGRRSSTFIAGSLRVRTFLRALNSLGAMWRRSENSTGRPRRCLYLQAGR